MAKLRNRRQLSPDRRQSGDVARTTRPYHPTWLWRTPKSLRFSATPD